MKSPSMQTASPNEPSPDADAMAFADPWEALDEDREKHDGWLLSYIDILTLFLTLFVVLLALQPKNEAPPVDANPGESRVVSPEPIERQTAPPILTVQVEPPREQETMATLPDLPVTIETAGNNESDAGIVQTFSNLAVLAEHILPLIYTPLEEEVNLGDPNLLPSTTDPGNDSSTVIADANRPAEPAANAPPATQENSREQVQLFMTKLSQQHLDDRVRVSEVAEGVHLEVSDNILFALGSAELKRDGASLLNELAQLLAEHQGIISVEGHTDDSPIANDRFPSNWELSSGRATTVTRYLIEKGLDPTRLRAVGYADTRPLEDNTSIAGRARNRRVALIVEIPEV